MSKMMKKIVSLLMCAALVLGYLPAISTNAATPLNDSVVVSAVTDPGTAASWEHMMGTDADGNRYAGRVWVDKSVYADGDTVVLNTRGESGSSFVAELEEGEAFQIVFSALGSTMTSKETISSTGPLDVVLVLDDSTSMDDKIEGNTTRLEKLIQAANKLLANLTDMTDIRIGIVAYNADAMQILPFGAYDNGVELRVRNGKYTFDENNRQDKGGTIQAFDKSGTLLYNNTKGYNRGTNTQSGINMGMGMLETATNTAGRTPVAIVLTDGAANTAVQNTFYNIEGQTPRSIFTGTPSGVVLATLLNASYKRVKVEGNYGKAPMIYGIGVDLAGDAGANAVINPGAARNGFNDKNSSGSITAAYALYQEWLKGRSVECTESYMGSYKFTFDHGYSGVTLAQLQENVNYVDTYYPVSSAELEDTFQQIYEELSSGAFNPITSSSTVIGGTGVDDTPLIYVDFIGEYMEVKEIQSVTLFGASYGVTKHDDGTYTVNKATGTNPTTNEKWNTEEDIRISVTPQADGTQKLEIRINQEILPIILEQVISETVGNVTESTITEYTQDPLRVYYTVGVASDILLPSGEVDVSKLQGYSELDDAAGTVSFYSNRFGVENAADGSGVVTKGDAHVGFQPSPVNRYYYHQANQGIFTGITDSDGKPVTIPENNEYGILWDADEYTLTWMSYEEYKAAESGDTVYTYVTYYRPNGDAPNGAEEVTYLVYTDWKYLKESVAFYDDTAKAYLNDGKAIPEGQVEAAIAEYKAAKPGAKLYAVLGVGSRRTSRLHNMMVDKTENVTGTAVEHYTPEYLENKSQHNDNDVVVWLGNNGKLTVEIDTGIALTKSVTEPIGNVNDTYALTVTLPAGVAAQPVVKDDNGQVMASTYENNVLTVRVRADETVYITGIPAGTVCAVDEVVPAGAAYHIAQKTDTVTVPALSEVLAGAAQFAPATVTNAPYHYGDLTIIKDIDHDLSETPAAMADKEFTFHVRLDPIPENKTYQLDTANASLIGQTQLTVADDGTFTVKLKANESVTVIGLPEGTGYTVTETNVPAGYENTTGTVTGTVLVNSENHAHFVNAYGVTPMRPEITVTGTKTLEDPHGTYTDNEDFTFVLSQYTGNGYTTLATANAKAGESYTFYLQDEVDALGVGEYYFRVTEQAGATPGMTYDATRGLFKVTVTDEDADGTLEFTVTDAGNTAVSGNTVTKDFVNHYDVARTSVDISITKKLTNKTGVNLPLNLFHFELVNTGKPDGDGNIPNKTVTTDASGKAVIRLSDLGPGEYTYTLTEVEGDLPGMTYDTTPRVITVTVVEEAGELTATVQIDGTETAAVTFQNEYKLTKTSHTISGTKVLNGRRLQNGEFRFALYETDASFQLAANATPKQTVTNSGDGFSFDKIDYTRVGTYYYSVKELVPDSKLPGVTYDTTHYHITVTVTVDGDSLQKSVTVNKIGHNVDASGEVVFVNNYTAKPTEFAISGTKTLTGRSQHAGEFTFELYNEAGEKIDEAANRADGSFTFKAITYDQVGEYHYTVKEVAGNTRGIGYDNRVLSVTVTVTDAEANLVAEANKTPGQLQFSNTYTPDPATVTFSGTKTLEGGDLEAGMFTFLLYETDGSFDITGKDPKATADNGEDGSFKFSRIRYENTGTYFYVIVEDLSDPLTGIVYDKTHHKLMVQVRDVGDGQLRAAVTDMVLNETTGSSESAGMSVAFTNGTFEEAALKEVFLGDQTTMIDGQKVEAGDVLTYHITYTNFNGVPVVADIMDTIPTHTTYVEGSADNGGTYAGTHVNWILNVAAGESVTVSFQVKVDAEEVIVSNTAVIRDGNNTYDTNEVFNHTVDEEMVKDVFLAEDPTVSIDGQKVEEGDELLYQIRFTNTTPNPVDLTITDTVPVNSVYVEGSADNGGVYSEGVIVWQLQSIPAWETVTVTFKVKVAADIGEAVIRNQATATDGNNQFTTNWVSNYTEPEAPVPPPRPQTGDNTKLHIWMAMLTVSSLGVAAMGVFGRKKETEAE